MSTTALLKNKNLTASSDAFDRLRKSPPANVIPFEYGGIRKADLDEPVYDYRAECYIIKEQLYPESRGWLERKFDTRLEAQQFYENAPE